MNKYGARKTVVDGVTFASAAEARRYSQLKLLEAAGEIRDLQLQPRYPLVVEGEKIGTYVGDFLYQDRLTGKRCVEDVKGYATQVYKMKKKLVKALYGIDVLEVRRP